MILGSTTPAMFTKQSIMTSMLLLLPFRSTWTLEAVVMALFTGQDSSFKSICNSNTFSALELVSMSPGAKLSRVTASLALKDAS
jgi:H+/gluconate symporter-like permease